MQSAVSIRAAGAEDFRAIYGINSQSWPAVARLAPGDLDHVVTLATVAWVAVSDEAISGYLIGYAPHARYDGEEFAWFRSNGHGFLYVDQVAVALPHRRRGIGAALYEALETQAQHERLASLACEVNVLPPNPGSMAFHLRRGFAEINRLQTRDARSVALLRKQLPGAG
jgi:predicted GNAT superfamily acetyltransferase